MWIPTGLRVELGVKVTSIKGSTLRVSSPHCVSVLTDHSLVALRVFIPKKSNQNQQTNAVIVRFRFRPELMESFTDILKSDEMSSRLECIRNENLSAVESCPI